MASIFERPGKRGATKFYVKYALGGGQFTRKLDTACHLRGEKAKREARSELGRVEQALREGRDPFPEGSVVQPKPVETVGQLLDRWSLSLTNRNADDDRSRVKTYLRPRFGELLLADVDLPAVMNWIGDMTCRHEKHEEGDEKGKCKNTPPCRSAQTQRHALNALSRFFSWCIERGLATINPVKMVPQGKRPVGAVDPDRPWLEDEAKVQRSWLLSGRTPV
jgi:hypothetical protein